MRKVKLRRREDFSAKDYIRRMATEEDYNHFYDEDFIAHDKDTGQLILVYFTLPKIDHELLAGLHHIEYGTNTRTGGLVTTSRIFGYRPREEKRNNFCSSSSMASQHPAEHSKVCDFGRLLTKYYKQYCGDVYDEHAHITKTKVLPEWQIEDTPFTSGIINKNNELAYHFDSGNFANVYSNMVAFKHNIKGGFLAIPEYDVGIKIANRSVLLFDGQKILHGVTPIKRMAKDAYRYTIVYYTLKRMWKCEPVTKEVARFRDIRTKIERERLLRLQGKLTETPPGFHVKYRKKDATRK